MSLVRVLFAAVTEEGGESARPANGASVLLRLRRLRRRCRQPRPVNRLRVEPLARLLAMVRHVPIAATAAIHQREPRKHFRQAPMNIALRRPAAAL